MDAGGLETCGVVLDNIWQGCMGSAGLGRQKKQSNEMVGY